MDIQDLQRHVLRLATLEESSDPMISCYLNFEFGPAGAQRAVDERARLLRKSLAGRQYDSFEQALNRIDCLLASGFGPEVKGVAVFSRSGDREFFLDLEFRVPLPNLMVVNSTPCIYHLVEMKDTYHRYVVVLVNERKTRILEVQLGAVTADLWAKRPDLRERVGSGWTQEHYQSHCRERSHQFAKEVVGFLDEVISDRGYSHLILAGSPKMTAMLRQALPKHLSSKLIDVVPASVNDRTSDVVSATLASFIEKEQQESLAAVERLQKEIRRDGLAVVGSRASLQALKRRQVDLLVMATEYVPEPAWICSGCGAGEVGQFHPAVCPKCGCAKTREVDCREELAKLAELAGCEVEIVRDSEVLMRLGGVGCLLRFLSPEAYVRAVA